MRAPVRREAQSNVLTGLYNTHAAYLQDDLTELKLQRKVRSATIYLAGKRRDKLQLHLTVLSALLTVMGIHMRAPLIDLKTIRGKFALLTSCSPTYKLPYNSLCNFSPHCHCNSKPLASNLPRIQISFSMHFIQSVIS